MLISVTIKDDEVVALLHCKALEACDSLVKEDLSFRGVDDRRTPYNKNNVVTSAMSGHRKV